MSVDFCKIPATNDNSDEAALRDNGCTREEDYIHESTSSQSKKGQLTFLLCHKKMINIVVPGVCLYTINGVLSHIRQPQTLNLF